MLVMPWCVSHKKYILLSLVQSIALVQSIPMAVNNDNIILVFWHHFLCAILRYP